MFWPFNASLAGRYSSRRLTADFGTDVRSGGQSAMGNCQLHTVTDITTHIYRKMNKLTSNFPEKQVLSDCVEKLIELIQHTPLQSGEFRCSCIGVLNACTIFFYLYLTFLAF